MSQDGLRSGSPGRDVGVRSDHLIVSQCQRTLALGLVAQQQALFYEKRAFASTFARATDYVAIARSFGMPAFDLRDKAGKTSFWRDILTTPGPCLIRAAIDVSDHALPIVPPGAANWEAIGG